MLTETCSWFLMPRMCWLQFSPLSPFSSYSTPPNKLDCHPLQPETAPSFWCLIPTGVSSCQTQSAPRAALKKASSDLRCASRGRQWGLTKLQPCLLPVLGAARTLSAGCSCMGTQHSTGQVSTLGRPHHLMVNFCTG